MFALALLIKRIRWIAKASNARQNPSIRIHTHTHTEHL